LIYNRCDRYKIIYSR